MNILLVAATKPEIQPFLNTIYPQNFDNDYIKNILFGKLHIDILITGVGVVFTTYKLTNALKQRNYDIVLNAGIAGSFSIDLQIGEVLIVGQEEFGDLGIEDKNSFYTIFEKGFTDKNTFPFQNGKLICNIPDELKLSDLKMVKSLTVNTTHGKETSISQIKHKFDADIESMEGAAFFYVCLMEKVKFFEIRAISNYVEPRDIKKWNIPLAIENLSVKLMQIISAIKTCF